MSKVLHAHPEILSLNEFYGFNRSPSLSSESTTGARFWKTLTEPSSLLDNLVRTGARIPEILYSSESGRFSPSTGVPPICYATLPLLSDDPDGLYGELAAVVPTWPYQPIPHHYRRLFGWLADRFGRSVVVERTGSSLTWVAQLVQMFPEARFVHLYRDGVDCALSMSRHPVFHLVVLLQQAAEIAGVGWIGDLGKQHAPLLPAPLAQVVLGDYSEDLLMRIDIPLATFGELWSAQVTGGVAELRRLPADMWTSMSYESFLTDPAAALTRLAEFIGVQPAPAWLRYAAEQVDPSRVGAKARLSAEELAQLDAACAPGRHPLRSSL